MIYAPISSLIVLNCTYQNNDRLHWCHPAVNLTGDSTTTKAKAVTSKSYFPYITLILPLDLIRDKSYVPYSVSYVWSFTILDCLVQVYLIVVVFQRMGNTLAMCTLHAYTVHITVTCTHFLFLNYFVI